MIEKISYKFYSERETYNIHINRNWSTMWMLKNVRRMISRRKSSYLLPPNKNHRHTTPTYPSNNSILDRSPLQKRQSNPVSRQKSWSWLITVMGEKWRRAKEAKTSFAKRRGTRGVVWSMMSERSGKDARYRRVHVRWYSAIKPPPSSLFPSSLRKAED